MFDRHTQSVADGLVRDIVKRFAAFQVADVPSDLADTTTSAKLDLGPLPTVFCDDLVTGKLECADILAKHVERQLDLHVSDQERYTGPSEANTEVQGIPSSDLRACL